MLLPQGRWYDDSSLLTLPHFGEAAAAQLAAAGLAHLPQLLQALWAGGKAKQSAAAAIEAAVGQREARDVLAVCERLPVVGVSWQPPALVQRTAGDEASSSSGSTTSYSIEVELQRLAGKGGSRQSPPRVYAPRFPKVGERKKDRKTESKNTAGRGSRGTAGYEAQGDTGQAASHGSPTQDGFAGLCMLASCRGAADGCSLPELCTASRCLPCVSCIIVAANPEGCFSHLCLSQQVALMPRAGRAVCIQHQYQHIPQPKTLPFVQVKEEGWWLVAGDTDSGELFAIKRVSFGQRTSTK